MQASRSPSRRTLSSIGDFVRAQLDGSNDLLYCASPSGAFIDALGL